MKKFSIFCVVSILFIAGASVNSRASLPLSKAIAYNIDSVHNPVLEVLVTRLFEIKNMDMTSLTKNQRQTLRKEVRAINKAVVQERRGVYLSLTAVIIVLLLLIILL